MLGHRHQLDVREAEVVHVRGELVCRLLVGHRSAPRTEVGLVDRQLTAPGVVGHPALLPRIVGPRVGRLVDDARRARRDLRGERERIGLLDARAALIRHGELVAVPRARARHERGPHTGAHNGSHRVGTDVEAVEVADHGNVGGGWRPHREARSFDAVDPVGVRAEMAPQAPMPALVEEMPIDLAPPGISVGRHEAHRSKRTSRARRRISSSAQTGVARRA